MFDHLVGRVFISNHGRDTTYEVTEVSPPQKGYAVIGTRVYMKVRVLNPNNGVWEVSNPRASFKLGHVFGCLTSGHWQAVSRSAIILALVMGVWTDLGVGESMRRTEAESN